MHGFLLGVFGKLPAPLRRRIVAFVAPSFTVGAICVIEHDDRIVMIRQRYRNRWGLPGGLLARGEEPADAARREVREEIGIDVGLLGDPFVVVEPGVRRVDLIYRARPLGSVEGVRPTSPEILAAEWFGLDELPDLQPETLTALAVLGRRHAPDR